MKTSTSSKNGATPSTTPSFSLSTPRPHPHPLVSTRFDGGGGDTFFFYFVGRFFLRSVSLLFFFVSFLAPQRSTPGAMTPLTPGARPQAVPGASLFFVCVFFVVFFCFSRTVAPAPKRKKKKRKNEPTWIAFFCQPIRDDVGGPVAQSSQTFVLKTNEGEEEQDRKIESPFQNK